MTVREKAELIVKDIKKEQGTNPVLIFKNIAEKEYVSIHGPEHHIFRDLYAFHHFSLAQQKILGPFQYHPKPLKILKGQAGGSAGGDNFFRALYPYSRYPQQSFVGSLVDLHWEKVQVI